MGVPPKSSIYQFIKGFPIINHPFWGSPIVNKGKRIQTMPGAFPSQVDQVTAGLRSCDAQDIKVLFDSVFDWCLGAAAESSSFGFALDHFGFSNRKTLASEAKMLVSES